MDLTDRKGTDIKLGAEASLVSAEKSDDKTTGVIEAIVSVFGNVDSYGDRILKGAFVESLKERTPKGLWAHDWTQPVAKTLDVKELEPLDERLGEKNKKLGGLYVKGKFNLDTQRGAEAFSDIEAGIIDEFSIGLRITKGQWVDDKEFGDVYEIAKCNLYEWSPVVAGANPDTSVVSVKSGVTLQTQFDQGITEVSRLGVRLKRIAGQRKDKLSDDVLLQIHELATRLSSIIDGDEHLAKRLAELTGKSEPISDAKLQELAAFNEAISK